MEVKFITDKERYEVYLFFDKVLYTKYFNLSGEGFSANLELDTFVEVHSRVLNELTNKPFYSIVDVTSYSGGFSKESRDYVVQDSELTSLIKKEALIVSTVQIRLVVLEYMMFDKPPIDIEVMSPGSFRDWLRKLSLSENEQNEIFSFFQEMNKR